MSVVARFTVPANQFVLGELLEVRRGVKVRLESVIPTGETIVPYFWVSSKDADAVAAALQESDVVDEVSVVDRTETETLFRIHWAADVNGLLEIIRDSEAVLLQADGMGDDWAFRMRFPDRDHLSAFYRRCRDQGLTPDLGEINDPLGSSTAEEFGITPAQREALLLALEEGYFDVPRGINLTTLAQRLDISDTAASQRIRRGLTALLQSTLT